MQTRAAERAAQWHPVCNEHCQSVRVKFGPLVRFLAFDVYTCMVLATRLILHQLHPG